MTVEIAGIRIDPRVEYHHGPTVDIFTTRLAPTAPITPRFVPVTVYDVIVYPPERMTDATPERIATVDEYSDAERVMRLYLEQAVKYERVTAMWPDDNATTRDELWAALSAYSVTPRELDALLELGAGATAFWLTPGPHAPAPAVADALLGLDADISAIADGIANLDDATPTYRGRRIPPGMVAVARWRARIQHDIRF